MFKVNNKHIVSIVNFEHVITGWGSINCQASWFCLILFKSMKLFNSYMHNRHQLFKKNNFYSPWAEILSGVQQGSVIRPIFFDIFLCDLFLFIKNKTQPGNKKHDILKTQHPEEGDSAYVIYNLKVLGNTLLNQFNNKSIKTNPGKYHFFYLVITPVKSQSEVKHLPVVNAKNLKEQVKRLTLSVPEKLKNKIAVIPTTSAKSLNLDSIRKLNENSLKKFLLEAMFTLTVFETLLFEGRSVL